LRASELKQADIGATGQHFGQENENLYGNLNQN
jgi:hypothetical protein